MSSAFILATYTKGETQSKLSQAQFKPLPNGLANRRKFAKVKSELAYGLAKGVQTDS